MKISCQSCHSKYNVADDKVQGKIVKIRCRKCGATIVVNATAGMASNGSAAGPLPTGSSIAPVGGEAYGLGPAIPAKGGVTGEWHVSVSEADQRTMSLEELVTAYNAGEVAQDVFVWTEGMEDWKPLGEVDTVVSALYAFAGQAASHEAVGHAAPAPVAASPGYEAASLSPGLEPAPAYGAGIAAHTVAAGVVSGEPAPEPRRAAVVKREARARDLFATRSGDELQGSVPLPPGSSGPGTDDSRLTGQRNENSVLFSLDHLTRNAAAPAARFEPASGPSKDDSGLIDLKALALKAESMRPLTTAQPNLLAPPLGFAPPLGAPIGGFGAGPEAPPKSKLPLLIGAGAGIALLMVLCIVIGLKIGGAATPAVSAAASASASATPSAAAAEPTPSASTAAVAAAQASASASGETPVAAAPKPHPAGGVTWKPNPAAGAGAGAKPAPAGASPPAGATPSPGSKKGDCGCNGDLMCMMKCSTH
jgi:predicted Zn finger-like uncharacterized protein